MSKDFINKERCFNLSVILRRAEVILCRDQSLFYLCLNLICISCCLFFPIICQAGGSFSRLSCMSLLGCINIKTPHLPTIRPLKPISDFASDEKRFYKRKEITF
jgi:hypothetical protein